MPRFAVARVVGADDHDAIGIVEGKPADEHGVHEREHGVLAAMPSASAIAATA